MVQTFSKRIDICTSRHYCCLLIAGTDSLHLPDVPVCADTWSGPGVLSCGSGAEHRPEAAGHRLATCVLPQDGAWLTWSARAELEDSCAKFSTMLLKAGACWW